MCETKRESKRTSGKNKIKIKKKFVSSSIRADSTQSELDDANDAPLCYTAICETSSYFVCYSLAWHYQVTFCWFSTDWNQFL